MPEGDTLWRTAAALRERIAGQVCRSVVPDSFGRLVGRSVTEVSARGKHLFITFDSGIAIHTHLRMQGAWYVHRPGEPFRRPRHQLKLALTFDDWVAVVFSAPVVELVAGDERVRHLGPDILSDGFDTEEVVRLAVTESEQPIGEVLLDQRVCAGIGNIWRCESLWEERVNPWMAVGALSSELLVKLYGTARSLMVASAQGIQPRRRMAVHGRGNRPCRRCSHLVHVRTQGNPPRFTYWCPYCQSSMPDTNGAGKP